MTALPFLSFLTSYVHLNYLFETFARHVASAINSTFYWELQQKSEQQTNTTRCNDRESMFSKKHRLQLLLVNRQLVSKKTPTPLLIFILLVLQWRGRHMEKGS